MPYRFSSPTCRRKEQGFTILEISIVLLIAGLLVAGVFVGQDLIRSSQLQRVLGEYDSHTRVIQQFQDKYAAMPGDMSTASSVWSDQTNGDGDGRIGSVSDITDGTLSDQAEWFRAWRHLARAQLISGVFTGTTGGAGAQDAIPGTNVPASQLSDAGWTLNYYLQTSTDTSLWGDDYGHMLWFGGYSSNNFTNGVALTPAEAYNLDLKMDDGKPGTGNIRAWRTGHHANCTTSDSSQENAVYYEVYTGTACALGFITGF